MSQTIHSFPKNTLEEVRASLMEFKGNQYIDLRVYYKAEDEEFRPSKKGLTPQAGLRLQGSKAGELKGVRGH